MGGRGASSGMDSGKSGQIKGLSVTMNGEKTTYYFDSKNGTNFYTREFGGIPEPTPMNMTPKEFKRRLESNGATTKTIGQKEYAKKESKYKKDRRKTENDLNNAWYKAAPRPRKGMKGH